MDIWLVYTSSYLTSSKLIYSFAIAWLANGDQLDFLRQRCRFWRVPESTIKYSNSNVVVESSTKSMCHDIASDSVPGSKN
jgi:hypothetical protein